MVGNDVIDLDAPESDASTLHPRFDARVFCVHERESIASAEDPVRERWCLWAAKEAAFKLARQRDPKTVFSPIQFEVHFEDAPGEKRRGRVCYGARRDRLRIEEGLRFIHALVIDEAGDFSAVAASVRLREEAGSPWEAVRDDESAAVRRLACDEIARRLGEPASDSLEVRRDGRIPRIWRRGQRLPMSLSLSHHGDFIAYACVGMEAAG